MQAYPASAPQAQATTDLVQPPARRRAPAVQGHVRDATALVGGFTAGSIDFSHVLASKLPLFIGIVVVLSALLLFVIFRSLVIPVQAALMNLLSIGGALGATVLVFQDGLLAGVLGVDEGPGRTVDTRAHVRGRVRPVDGLRGVPDLARARGMDPPARRHGGRRPTGSRYTGRVISAAAAIMICVFLSFMLGDERSVKEFGFGLAAAVFLDALVIRCVLLPAVLEILGPLTWKLPHWLDAHLPRIRIEGHEAETAGLASQLDPDDPRAATPESTRA